MGNIYLTGMMGSGKSVTGRKLAAKMEYPFTDLDEKIQLRTKKTIHELFAKGEETFRHEESLALRDAAESSPRVIATGGGVILKPANIDFMRQTGKIIFLETSPDMLWNRVKDKKDRPLLRGENPKDNLLKIFSERQKKYEDSSDLKVNTDGKTAAAVADEIFGLLKVNL